MARPYYPHMKKHEAEIWDRFMSAMPWRPVTILYDVRLGKGAPLNAEDPDWVRRMVWSLSTKRVDAIVETRRDIYICEIKARAGLSALGQLLGYESLYMEQFRPRKRVHLVLICTAVEEDMATPLGQYGIQTFVV